ncbi:MAG: helix-turn-helix domain-containing protein [Ignavibacteria bacterium]|nr:helix-turn-helix domain-containing protein [Ignavibacteria bacterium]
MLKQGASKDQRIEFLREESSRLIRQSEITLVDSMNAVFAELSRNDVIHGLDEMHDRFQSYGFAGTLRSLRNHQRAMGVENNGLDAVSVQCAIAVLEYDEAFIETLKRVFLPFLETLLDSEEIASVQTELVKLGDQRMLRSEKERQAVGMITNALQRFDVSQLDYSELNVRDVAYLRGRMLDVEIADMLMILISRLGPSVLVQFLSSTRESQVEIYSNVMIALVNERLAELEVVAASPAAIMENDGAHTAKSKAVEANKRATNDAQLPDLMTLSEVMSYMKISRSALFELRKTGALEVRHVGSSVRVTRDSVARYLDMK